jgi:hypothetical protein
VQVPNAPIRVDRATLRQLKVSEVITRSWPNPNIPNQVSKAETARVLPVYAVHLL